MKNLLNRSWDFIKKFFFGTWYVWFAVIIALIVGLIWEFNVGIFTGFGIVLTVILFVFGRQVWWLVSGTGDYAGREGLLLRLYKKIFKK